MSFLLGNRTERLPLDVAVDHLVGAARWAGAPSALWLAGLFYPEVVDAWMVVEGALGSLAGLAGMDFELASSITTIWGQIQAVRVFGDLEAALPLMLIALPLALLAARLSAGLARLAAAEQRGSLRSVWRAGLGHSRSTFGLWIILAALLVGVLLVLVLPLVGLIEVLDLHEWSPALALLVTPALFVVLLYSGLLQIVQQLALHSLVQNERGVSSALTHGWRLVRNAPWSAVRAVACDCVLVLLAFACALVSGVLYELSDLLALVFVIGFSGYIGTVRATFWGRVYRALGGQVAGDPLHGLHGGE